MTRIRLKHVARVIAGQAPAGDAVVQEGSIPFLQGCAEFGARHPTAKHFCEIPSKLAPRGAWLMSVRAPVGEINFSDRQYGIGRGLAAIVPVSCDPRFLGYALLHARGDLGRVSTGSTYDAVSASQIGNLMVPLPDPETQKAIADFLDRETARIDQLIEKKQRFLTVLDQKWAATVTFTLTNGLQAGVPLKDSGISWIGETPAHWDVAKLGHIGRCANGINISGDAFGSGYPFVSYGDVYKNAELPKTVAGLVQSAPEDRARYSLKAGDVLFTRTSETIDEIGFSSVCMEDMSNAVYAGFLIRFRPSRRKLTPQFSKFLFRNRALRAFFSKEMMIVTRASLSQGLLQKMPVLLPTLPEQEKIAEYLQHVENTHVSVAEKTKTSIDRLREFRAALITAAVTGQIDVTTWAKQRQTDCRRERIEEAMGT